MLNISPLLFARLWLILFVCSATIASFFTVEIEAHVLTRVLHFGFDAFGRNCFLLALTAAFESFKIVIPIGVVCIATSLCLCLIGISKNRKLKLIWDTLIDTLSSLPGFLIALALSVFLSNQFYTLLLAASLLVVPYLVRFFESQMIHLQANDFIKSAEALGANSIHIFLKHLLPELWASTLAILPFLFTRLLLIETSLAFLGLSHSSQSETWGRLMLQGKDYMLEAPWISLFCGLPLFLTLLSFHLLSRVDQS